MPVASSPGGSVSAMVTGDSAPSIGASPRLAAVTMIWPSGLPFVTSLIVTPGLLVSMSGTAWSARPPVNSTTYGLLPVASPGPPVTVTSFVPRAVLILD